MVISAKLTNFLAYSSLAVRRASHFGKLHSDLPYQLLLSRHTSIFQHQNQVRVIVA